ncbi:hypothetical protein SHD39_000514 [Campylobacter jejuni]|nr:hypothetical protein [Campylobacter jejuni]ELV2933710.1 hypothetical protein [Campylobacter jejuni]ELV5341818.1 hypothetical protein [Campylobacter jejuni]
MQRQSPEQILKKLEVKAKEEEKNKLAKLKIFLGYAAGVRGILKRTCNYP